MLDSCILPAAIAGVVAAKNDLDNLVRWAREAGIVRLKLDGLELELGPLGRVPVDESRVIADAERTARIARKREQIDIEWGHVGGSDQLSDEDIEEIVAGRKRFP